MILRETFQLDNSTLERATLFIHDALSELGTDKKQRLRSELLCEETIARLIESASENAALLVQVKKSLGETSVSLKMQGEEFDASSDTSIVGIDPDESHSLEAIRSIVLMAYGDSFKYTHRKKENRVRIIVERGKQSIYITLLALALGILFGVAMKMVVPAVAADAICDYLLVPFKTIFMNALKMIIAPVVFLSLVTAFSQYGSISEFGKLGAKVMSFYLVTTICAVLIGLALFRIIQPGEFGFALAGGGASYEASSELDVSIIDTLINIVPSNIVAPFLESNTLQLMFLAVICGVALGMIGDYAATLRDLFDALNSLFLTITRIITRAIPIAAFCSMAILVKTLELSAFGDLASGVLAQILGVCCMLVVYGLIILLMGRLNPLTFFKKARDGMLTSLTLSSSSAAMPTNLKICTDKLGISPKVCNFSIPLGATVNMDGTCIYLTMFGLFLARAYGVEVQASQLLPLAFTVILLSLGAPGVPGVGLLCIGVVLGVLNVPIEAIGLIIAVNPITDMIDTMSNTTGDMAVSLVIAKREKLLDVEKYNS